MRFGSVCSGIEAASHAWEPLGFTPAWFSEIAPFPSKFLAHRFPHVPNHGSLVGLTDRLVGDARRIDLLVGGTPCQSFSVAGLRGGLADERGNLALEFARLAAALRPRWLLWENVPGVLSSDGGRAFASLLRGLSLVGYGLAWRVLDAQFFGVAQRRERVFLVGHLGAAAAAGAVLFEPEGVRGFRPTRPGKPAESFARCDDTASGVRCLEHGGDWDDCGCFCADDLRCPWCGEWTSGLHYDPDEVGFTCCGAWVKRTCGTLSDGAHMGGGLNGQDGASGRILVDHKRRVRRLTPLECERLQGFPDGWTDIPGATDGPRYRAIGNTMAVPVMRWIGERIAKVDALLGGAS